VGLCKQMKKFDVEAFNEVDDLRLCMLQFFLIFGALITLACYQFMVFMSRPSFTETGAILDSGVDLNMQAGVAEYVIVWLIKKGNCMGAWW
jgi:hypothetical protein